jgi:DMSO/TMAO reductase YedYZ molybdopterin-dependent catalytic subunit
VNEGFSQRNFDLNVVSQDPLCGSARLNDLEQRVTPTRNFFIRNHFPIPNIDVSNWSLSVWGEVEKPLMLQYDDLRQLPSKDVVSLLECAGNSRAVMQPPAEGVLWDHGAVGTAHWTGVPVSAVLEQVSLKSSATDVLFEGADFGKESHAPGSLAATELSYAMSVPLEKVLHPDTILAYEINGEVLPQEHGYPVRLLVPGWYGMASVKWLVNIRVLDQPFRGFHENDYYVYVAEGGSDKAVGERVTTTRVKSLITSPNRGGLLSVGTNLVRGIAWSGEAPIVKVEVSADDNRTWHSATVDEPSSPYGWQHWEYQWEAGRPGHYLIRSRATDEKGNVQPLQATWNFRGYAVNSMHTVPVTVSAAV